MSDQELEKWYDASPNNERPGPDSVGEPGALPLLELKPRKGSFIFPRVLMGLIAFFVIGIITSSVLLSINEAPWPGLVVFAAGFLLNLIAGLAAYRKERYLIECSRVLCHRGGLFSDETTELEIRNITRVKIKLP